MNVLEHWFVSVADAQASIEACRVDDNTVRPHSALRNQTPAAVALASRVRLAGPLQPGVIHDRLRGGSIEAS
jgi:transposase InsO family protein